MTLYGRFKRLKIDFEQIGMNKGPERGSYYCTPIGAKVIGWAGVDGIHYCLIKGFGEMVFMVDPSHYGGKQVQPLARNFAEFLRLLLVCGAPVLLEDAGTLTEEAFDSRLEENHPSPEQRAVLDKIRKAFSLMPMEQPFAYIKELQTAFDDSQIRYPAEYYEAIPVEQEEERPEWKVYFNGGFRAPDGRERPGKEIPVGKTFTWGKNSWYIPAMYACGEGLVIDICRRVDPVLVRAFYEKYRLAEMDAESVSKEQWEQHIAENPMIFECKGKVRLNGRELLLRSIQCVYWECKAEGAESEDLPARQAVEHYGFDPAFCWAVHRMRLSWATKRKPVIRSLSMTLEKRMDTMPGPRFSLRPGESLTFVHPVTGREHTLTVQGLEQQKMEVDAAFREDLEFPLCYTMMTYTLVPDIPAGHFFVLDCDEGDPARRRNTHQAEYCAVIRPMIRMTGGTDGPTAVFIAGRAEEPEQHAACSASHFEPVERVEWRIEFHEKLLEDIELALL